MRVQAIELGYYADQRKRPGQVFTLSSPDHFSKKWMKALDGKSVKGQKPNKKDTHSDEVEDVESQGTGDQDVI